MENTEDNIPTEGAINAEENITPENNVANFAEATSLEPMILNDEMKEYLLIISNWTRFLAIMGFVGIGIMVLVSIIMVIMGTTYSRFTGTSASSALVAFIYIIISVLYYFPINYLYQASKGLKNGILANNSEEVTNGIRNLKSHYKYVGILMIVVISLYIIIIMAAMLTAAFA